MKQKSLHFKFSGRVSLTAALLLIISGLYAQGVPEFVSRNPGLESGRISPGLAPVKLTNFTAKYDNKNVSLTWSTEQEKAFSHFVVERSTSGIDFNETAVIFANDNGSLENEYAYTDELNSANKGDVYYRLKMVDVNQQSQRSLIRMVRFGNELNEVILQAYPNPVVNELRITVPSAWQNKTVTYDLYNVSGKLVQRVVSNSAGQTEVLSMSSLNPGMYIMTVSSGNETAVKQVIKRSIASNIK